MKEISLHRGVHLKSKLQRRASQDISPHQIFRILCFWISDATPSTCFYSFFFFLLRLSLATSKRMGICIPKIPRAYQGGRDVAHGSYHCLFSSSCFRNTKLFTFVVVPPPSLLQYTCII